MQETNRYGIPIQELKVKEVIKDLRKLPSDIIIAYCAALIVLHQNHEWEKILEILLKETV